ncbi:MAG: glycosyltransferase family 2 protein [Bacteroidales bacterium]
MRGGSAMPEKPIADLSIIVPNYNNGRFLTAFFESIANSTSLPLELILVDDGSTDESAAVVAKFSSLEYIKVIWLPENRGMPAALNTGVEWATGKYIMRADPDDTFYPERIERQFQYMETHPEIDISGCQVQYFHYKTGDGLNTSNFPTRHTDIVRSFQSGVNGMQHPTIIARRTVFQAYRYANQTPGEDYDIFSRMARDGRHFANLDEPLYRMRIHPASSTSTITFESVRGIFATRDRIWGTRSSKSTILFYYFYIYFYRQYQINTNILTRHLFLLTAGIVFPARIIKRFRHS